MTHWGIGLRGSVLHLFELMRSNDLERTASRLTDAKQAAEAEVATPPLDEAAIFFARTGRRRRHEAVMAESQ